MNHLSKILIVSALVSTICLALVGCGVQFDKLASTDYVSDEQVKDTQGEPDFESSRWGDTIQQVMENDTGGSGAWTYRRSGSSFADMNCQTFFMFESQFDYTLQSAYYELIDVTLTRQEKFERAKEYLVELYGEPILEQYYDADDEMVDGTYDIFTLDGSAYLTWQVGDSIQGLEDSTPILVIQLDSRAGYNPTVLFRNVISPY